jgi:FkbM family methyltransferase
MIRGLRVKIANLKKKIKFRNFYRQYIKEEDLCFDIGANIGERTETFLNLKAKVVSVEPVKESYSILQTKFAANKNVTILPIAIGSVSEQRDIYISNYLEVCTLSELFIKKYKDQKEYNIKWDEVRSTEIKTLDQLIKDYGIPAFCKIDVEGYEVEVLKGLSQPIPLLSFEYNARLKNLALECIHELTKFDSLSYNFSSYESMKFSLNSWRNEIEFYSYIEKLPEDIETGDIYVRYDDRVI